MQAKVTKVISRLLVLADSEKLKGIRVSVPVNGTAPAEGALIEISEPVASERPVAKGKPVDVNDANFIGLVAKK